MLDIYTVATPTNNQHAEAQGRARDAWLAFTAADAHASDAEEQYDSGDITLEQLGELRQARHLASIAYNRATADEFAHYKACEAGEIDSIIMASGQLGDGSFYSETVHEGGGVTYWRTHAYHQKQQDGTTKFTVRSGGVRHGQREDAWTHHRTVRQGGTTKREVKDVTAAQAHDWINTTRELHSIAPATLTK